MSEADALHFHEQCKRWAHNTRILSMKSGEKVINGVRSGQPSIQVVVNEKVEDRGELSRPIPLQVNHSALEFQVPTDVFELDARFGDGVVRPGEHIDVSGQPGFGTLTGVYTHQGTEFGLTAGHVLYHDGEQLIGSEAYLNATGGMFGRVREVDFGQAQQTEIDGGTVAIEANAPINRSEGYWSGGVRRVENIRAREKLFSCTSVGHKVMQLTPRNEDLLEVGLPMDAQGSIRLFEFYGLTLLQGDLWSGGDSGTCVYDRAGNACFLVVAKRNDRPKYAWALPVQRILDRFGIAHHLV
jgi:hypothetical protein